MPIKPKIMIVDDEPSMVEWLSVFLDREGYTVLTATDPFKAVKIGIKEKPDVLLVDIKMPGKSGLEVFEELRKTNSNLIGIVMTAFSSIETAISAIRQGARDYLLKPFDIEQLTIAIKRALNERKMQSENVRLKRQVKRNFKFSEITGRSKVMLELLNDIRRVARTESTVLISGESGTGKELIARAIHYNSHRSDGPFLGVNCGGFSRDLLNSELFGHVKGSFTGAHKDKEGLLVAAAGGTFFMDEIGELDRDLQVKLLRALQERQVLPVGGTDTIPLDVRLVAATNIDLKKHVEEGSFRSDLYYRLNVIPVQIPPLRDRIEDIPLLVERFLETHARSQGKEKGSITPEAMEILCRYHWPGNVRELENLVERLCVMSKDARIDVQHLPDLLRSTPDRQKATDVLELGESEQIAGKSASVPLTPTLKEIEKAYTLYVLEHKAGGQKKNAAKILGIDESTLHRRLIKYESEESNN